MYTSKYEQLLWWTISHDANHAEDSSRDGSLIQIQRLGMLVTDTSLMLQWKPSDLQALKKPSPYRAKIAQSNKTDGVYICNFITNLDRNNKVSIG